MVNDIVYLRQQAERCRRLAADCTDAKTAHSLRLMAEDYAAKAAEAQTPEPAEFMLVAPRQS